MRFLSREDVNNLSPHVWRHWNPNKYKGALWWKLEDTIEISEALESPSLKHPIVEKHVSKVEYIPYGKLILKTKPSLPSALSLRKASRKSIPNRNESFYMKQKELSCVALACCKKSNKFVALDTLDNLYCYDLDGGEFWKIMHLHGIQIISFCHDSENEIVIGKWNSIIDKISIEPEIVIGHFTQHIFPVKDILFFSDEICLSYSQFEAWIWNCFTFEVIHSLTFKRGLSASIFTILPNSKDLLVTILSNRTLHLWKRDITNKEAPRRVASYCCNQFKIDCTVKCVAFNSTCTSMALAGKQKGISIVNIEEEYWTLERLLYLPQTANEVRQMGFLNIPVFNVGVKGSKITQCLAVFTSPFQEFLIYDLEERHCDNSDRTICFLIDVESEPRSFHLMPSEMFALFQLDGGFVDVYTTFWWLSNRFCPWLHYSRITSELTTPKQTERALELPSWPLSSERDHYRYMLWRLGVLPQAERQIYWRLALVLPGNIPAFRHLVLGHLHPASSRLDYPNLPKENLFSLIRLYSAFCYLSPLFYIIKHFPEILLHFCKIFTWNLMGVFECVLSIFNNYCSDWFVNYPNPPEKQMKTIISILKEKDPSLCVHFEKHGISPINVAWTLMSNFFTNALDFGKWSILWDHILFADKHFILMVTVSLILNSRCTFFQFQGVENFEESIRNSDLNIWSVILIAYDLLNMYLDKENSTGFFISLQKEGFDQFLQMKYNEETIWNAMHNKLDRNIINDTHLYKKIDLYKLLDPRPHPSITKVFFTNDDPSQHRLESSRNDLAEYVKEMEEKDAATRAEQTKFEELQREREYKFLHLLKLLETSELHWISSRQRRISDVARLQLFKTKWPEEYRASECSGRTEPRKLVRNCRKASQLHKSTILAFKTSSLEGLFQTSKKVRQLQKKKPSNSVRASVKPAPKEVQKSSTAGGKKRPAITKSKRKGGPGMPPLRRQESSTLEEEMVEGERETLVHDEYLEKWRSVNIESAALKQEIETVARELEDVRERILARRLEEWGEVPMRPRPDPPAQQLSYDWRKERREEFMDILQEVYEKLGQGQKK